MEVEVEKFQAEEAARGKLEAKLPGQVSLMTPLCIDLGSLGLSEFDGGLGQLSQRKHLLDFLSQEIKLEVFICFSPRWT